MSGPVLTPQTAFADTGFFAALANRADARHGDAFALARSLAAQRVHLVTSSAIIAETHSLVLARAGRELALRTLQSMLAVPERIVRVEAADEKLALQVLVRYTDKSFSFTDALSFVIMERLGIRVAAAFDRHFIQYGFTLLEP